MGVFGAMELSAINSYKDKLWESREEVPARLFSVFVTQDFGMQWAIVQEVDRETGENIGTTSKSMSPMKFMDEHIVTGITQENLKREYQYKQTKSDLRKAYEKQANAVMQGAEVHPQVLVVAVKLPSGAIEVITNTQELRDKIAYYAIAYDDRFRLKENPNYEIVSFMLV